MVPRIFMTLYSHDICLHRQLFVTKNGQETTQKERTIITSTLFFILSFHITESKIFIPSVVYQKNWNKRKK